MKIALIGLGSVGRGVAEMITKKDLGLTITGLADSKSGAMNPNGLDIPALLTHKNFLALRQSTFHIATPRRLTPPLHCLPPILHKSCSSPMPGYSKGA